MGLRTASRTVAGRAYASAVTVLLIAGAVRGSGDGFVLPIGPRAVLAAVCIAAALRLAKRSLRLAISALLGVGVAIALGFRLSVDEVATALGTWTDIVVLLAFVPIVSAVLVERRYIQVVVATAARLGSLATQLAVLVSSHIIGSVALLAVVPVLGDFLGLRDQPAAERHHYARLILRGFAPSVAWSPSTGGMGVILIAIGARWTDLAPVLLTVGGGALLLSAVWTVVSERRSGRAPILQDTHFATSPEDGRDVPSGRTRELLLFIAGTFGLILVLETLEFATTVIVVPIAMLSVSFLTLGLTEGWGRALALVRAHLRDRLPRGAGEANFLLAAGFAGTVLAFTGLSERFVGGIIEATGAVGIPVEAVLSLLVATVTMLTIPPLVAVALVSSAVPLALTGLSPALYASLLVVGTSTSLLFAPLTPTMLMVADYAGTGVTRTGFRDNRVFAPIYLVCLTLLAVTADRIIT